VSGMDYVVLFALANLVALFGTLLFATVADLIDAGRGGRRPPRM
jgi:hypothetical protein